MKNFKRVLMVAGLSMFLLSGCGESGGSSNHSIDDLDKSNQPMPKKSTTNQKDSRIVDGRRVTNSNTYPWMVGLIRSDDAYNDYGFLSNSIHEDHFCGGSLIAPNWVLTAAHCVDDKDEEDMEVLVNTNKLDTNGRSSKLVKVKDIVLHPTYEYYDSLYDNPYRYGYDIALIELESSVSNQTVDINTNYNLVGKTAKAIGWGYTNHNRDEDTTSEYLRHVDLPIVSSNQCKIPTIKSDILCAGYDSGYKSISFGDSGGPLVVYNNGRWKLAGVTSYKSSGTPYFSGFTQVSSFRSFINRHVQIQNDNPQDHIKDDEPSDSISNLRVSSITKNGATITWNGDTTVKTWVYVHSPYNKTGSKHNTRNGRYTYSSLAAGITFTVYIQDDNGNTLRKNFTTRSSSGHKQPTNQYYGAFAYSRQTADWGYSYRNNTEQQARRSSVSYCGRSDCSVIKVISGNECMSYAESSGGGGYWNANTNKTTAKNQALRSCNSNLGNCSVQFAFCADGR